ncbi:MAG: hypothetical protein N0E58_14845 [Candidatus Thiodiazotropha endolucinida]|uniref:Beta-propeller repeat protein n=1 Tax=Candidatus Thiodiazotropha taylori TaxID=2792791 RepID=A0A9E4NM82_9GAMM|nr:hypothetical protein [Candidatus Thiodiazotropha taylori]MCW4237526.1 hypothetical protein [Candidatus Thiodiazotropha endolucinida]
MHLLNSYLPKLFLVITASTWLVACENGSGEPAADTTPDAFHFDDQSDVTPNTVITSNRITVSGIEAAAAINVTDGEYAIDDNAFTSAAGTVSDGQTVTLRHTSSSLYTSATTTYLNIGGFRGSFTSTTVSTDTIPDAFSFVDQTDVAPNTFITSNRITLSGIDAAAAISVTDGEYAIDDNPFTSTAGTVSNGQTIRLRHTSSSSYMTMKSTFISIGGISGSFVSTTGPIGTGFNKARGFNGAVTGITPATDGSGDLYVIGDFTTYNSTASNHIIRLNSDGTVDTAFEMGTGFDEVVKSISSATDGSGDLYVGGDFTTYNGITSNHIIRLNSDGTVDTAFAVGTGFDGVYSSSTRVNSISPAKDSSGDLYVGGNFTTYNGIASNSIIRLNSDGTVDATFAAGTGFDGIYTSVYSVTPATDGSGDLYVGGNFTTYNGIASNNIIRLNSDGTVDNTFSVGSGFNYTEDFYFGLPPVRSQVNSIIPTTDGSDDLYVGGLFDTYNGTAINNIIRLNSDGTVDDTFTVEAGVNGIVRSISASSDGSGDLYLGGGFTTYNGTASIRIIRLHSDGTLETTFAVESGFDASVYSITPATDGSGDLYVGGAFNKYNDIGSNNIIRLNSDGTVDAGFTVASGFDASVNSISATADGSDDLYVSGRFTAYNGTTSNHLARLNSDGTVDTLYGVESGIDRFVKSIVPATDGSGDLYIGGYFSSYNDITSYTHLIRLKRDGTVDTTFEIDWNWTTVYESGVHCFSAATDGSGDIYVGGGFVVRMHFTNPSLLNTVTNNITRLNSDGSVDATFEVGNGFDDDVYSISPATDGSGDLYVGGEFTVFKRLYYSPHASNNIIRLNSNGTVDTAFAVGTGFETVNATQPDWVQTFNTVYTISPAIDDSGDLYVGGVFNTYNGIAINNIIRLNSDGSVDTAFEVGTGFDEAVRSIISTGDGSGDLYVGGEFTTYNGIASNHIIRLNSDGTVDTTFAVGSGFNSPVNTLSLATDSSGDLYVGGAFTSYQSSTVDKIARLNPDGSLN